MDDMRFYDRLHRPDAVSTVPSADCGFIRVLIEMRIFYYFGLKFQMRLASVSAISILYKYVCMSKYLT